MDTSYFIAEVRRREELESFAIKRFDSIFENRKKESLANVQRYGLEGYIRYLDSAPYPLGWEKEWGNLLMQYMREWVGLGYNRSQREIKAELLKSAADPYQKQINSAISYWDSYGLKLSQVEDRDVIDRVISQLQFGINQGLPIGDMQALLGQTLDTFKASRLENIARTESGKAYNWGIITNIYENSDICQYMEVMVVMDKRTTDICIARNGIVIPIKDTAMVAQYTPPYHFQCRTRLVAIVRPSTIKNLPPDKELIKRATDIEKNIPIFNGFGLSPSDMDIFLPTTTKTWILDPSKKRSQLLTNIYKTTGVGRDLEVYSLGGITAKVQNQIENSVNEYHALLDSDKLLEGISVTNSVKRQAAMMKWVDDKPNLLLAEWFFAKSPEKVSANCKLLEESGWSPIGCNSVKSIIDHEMGHYLNRLFIRSKYRDAFANDVNVLRKEILRLAGSRKVSGVKRYISKNLSRYSAIRTRELLADGWSEFLNSTSPRILAKKIGALYNKYILLLKEGA